MAKGKHVTAPPLVSLVTVHFNQPLATLALLESAQRLTYPRLEMLVVDNGSRTAPLDPAGVARFPGARLLVSAENRGFAGGNNLALREAKGDFFLLVNNDTELTPDLIETLLEPFATDETVGVVCPKIRYFHHPDVIQYAGYRPLNPWTGQTTPFGKGETDRGQYDRPGPTAFAHGAAILLRREVLDTVGPMDETFFLYYEELDWSHRIQRAGYRIFYQPRALVYHKESLSVGRQSPLKVYFQTRNRLLFMRRCATPPQRAVFAIYFLAVALPKNLFGFLLRGQPALAKAYLRGVGWHFSNRAFAHAQRSQPHLNPVPA